MRKTVLLLASTLLVAFLASNVALAVTKTGTNGDDRIVGTKSSDIMKGRDGDDKMSGLGKND